MKKNWYYKKIYWQNSDILLQLILKNQPIRHKLCLKVFLKKITTVIIIDWTMSCVPSSEDPIISDLRDQLKEVQAMVTRY